nr:hypothetical protein [uncultured Pseudogulbenkiania sp.]
MKDNIDYMLEEHLKKINDELVVLDCRLFDKESFSMIDKQYSLFFDTKNKTYCFAFDGVVIEKFWLAEIVEFLDVNGYIIGGKIK